MKIYFAGSVRGDDSRKEVFKHIISVLKSNGHQILTEHIAEDDIRETERRNTDDFIYKRDVDWLEEADIVVAEATGPSFGVGFEVAYAAEKNKKVYLLYDKSQERKISAMVMGNSHPNITRVPYSSLGELDRFLKKL
jgi:nucleoside 2-deoxyribosyltransferase